MTAVVHAKAAAATLFRATGMDRWVLRRRAVGERAILMYHRVLPPGECNESQAGMFVHPGTLQRHIEYLRDRAAVVSLSSLDSTGCAARRSLEGRPRCALTFDDGWRDFYQYAYPVLLREKAPATVFLPTDFIGTDRWFWTDRLGTLLKRIRPLDAPGVRVRPGTRVVGTILALRGGFGSRLEAAIEMLKPFRLEAINEVIDELDRVSGGTSMPGGRAFLSWDEVEEMFASGLVTFGSHTASHPIMTTLTEPEVVRELQTSRDVLLTRKVVDPNFLPFCYPNGASSSRIKELVRDTGYQMAVTTQRGWNRPDSDMYALRRIGMHEDITSTRSMFAARLAGLF